MGAAPVTFRCSKCKVLANTWDPSSAGYNPSKGTNVHATGRTKAPGNPLRGMPSGTYTRHEYRCEDCGFVGWSTHWRFQRKAAKP